jgi:hypothetical protein
MCLTKVAAGNDWSFIINGSGFLSGWGNPTALALLPLPEYIKNATDPFFTDVAIGGGATIVGVGFNIATRRNGKISVWGETFRGNQIREIEPSNNFGFTKVGATLNTAIAQRGSLIYFMGDVNITDITNNTPEIELGLGDPFFHNNRQFSGFDDGYFHILLHTISGTLLGYGDYNYFGAANIPDDLGSVSAYAAGYGYSLAVKKDGVITGWGVNGIPGDEVGFPPDWTIDTIISFYGSGQLNIPDTVKKFASGNAWTGIDSYFPWPGGKISKLCGGNGYAGAIVSEYEIDEFGDPITEPINVFYNWGYNPFYSNVPSRIVGIKDADIGKRSMLLINSGNNLIYYGLDPVNTYTYNSLGELVYTTTTGNFNNFCNNSYVTQNNIQGIYNLNGNYLPINNLGNTREVIYGDQLVYENNFYFGGNKRYGIRAVAPDPTVFVSGIKLEDLSNGESATARILWNGSTGEYPVSDPESTNLISINADPIALSKAGYDFTANWMTGQVEKSLGEYSYTSSQEGFTRVRPSRITAAQLNCELRPLIPNPCNPNSEPTRSTCWDDFLVSDWIYSNYRAQTRASSQAAIRTLETLQDVLEPWSSGSEIITLPPCISEQCLNPRRLTITFTRDSIENSSSIEKLNSNTFPATMSFWIAGINETRMSLTDFDKFTELKNLLKKAIVEDRAIRLIAVEKCCKSITSPLTQIEEVNLQIEGLQMPLFSIIGGDTFSLVQGYAQDFIPSKNYITNDPLYFTYRREDNLPINESSLQSLPCNLSIFSHNIKRMELDSYVADNLLNFFFNGATYPSIGVAPGILKNPDVGTIDTYLIPGLYGPILNQGYVLNANYNKRVCINNQNVLIPESITLDGEPLPGYLIYWGKQVFSPSIPYPPNFKTTFYPTNIPDTDRTHNGITAQYAGFGENYNLLNIKKDFRIDFDLSVRGDMTTYSSFYPNDSGQRWGIMGQRPSKEPFSRFSLPLADQNLPIGTNISLNRLLYQWYSKISAASSTFISKNRLFIKEGSAFTNNQQLSPRLLYPLTLGPFSKNILLSGYLPQSDFNENYSIGVTIHTGQNVNDISTEYILTDDNPYGIKSNIKEVPNGYIRSNFNHKLIIKNKYDYLKFIGLSFEIPIFEDMDLSFGPTYLNENQKYHKYSSPLFIPQGAQVSFQIYSQNNMGSLEEKVNLSSNGLSSYNNVLGEIRTSPDGYIESNFSPLHFKILDGNIPYLENPVDVNIPDTIIKTPISKPFYIYTGNENYNLNTYDPSDIFDVQNNLFDIKNLGTASYEYIFNNPQYINKNFSGIIISDTGLFEKDIEYIFPSNPNRLQGSPIGKIFYDESSSSIYAPSFYGYYIYNTVSKQTKHVNMGGGQYTDIIITNDKIYLNDQFNNFIFVLNKNNDSIIRTITGFNVPSNMFLDEQNDKLYVSSAKEFKVKIIDTIQYQLTGTINFLTNEWPRKLEIVNNKLYVITDTTSEFRDIVIVSGVNNINNVFNTYGPNSQGYKRLSTRTPFSMATWEENNNIYISDYYGFRIINTVNDSFVGYISGYSNNFKSPQRLNQNLFFPEYNSIGGYDMVLDKSESKIYSISRGLPGIFVSNIQTSKCEEIIDLSYLTYAPQSLDYKDKLYISASDRISLYSNKHYLLTLGDRPKAQISFPEIPNKNINSSPFNLDVTSNNIETGIIYKSSNSSVATVNANGNVNILATGNSIIFAGQEPTQNFALSFTSRLLTVS